MKFIILFLLFIFNCYASYNEIYFYSDFIENRECFEQISNKIPYYDIKTKHTIDIIYINNEISYIYDFLPLNKEILINENDFINILSQYKYCGLYNNVIISYNRNDEFIFFNNKKYKLQLIIKIFKETIKSHIINNNLNIINY